MGSSEPNVVLIVMDTTRADFLSCYGYPQATSPAIDRLAEEGVRYTRAFSTCYWTLPSHATLFSGLYPTEAGATSVSNRLPAKVNTLAELLGARGYHTVGAATNPWITRERGFQQGFEEFEETWRTAPERQAYDAAAEHAATWIRRFSESGRPFFLFVNLNSPHLPYSPPPEALEAVTTQPISDDALTRLSGIRGAWRHFAGQLELGQEDFTSLRSLYAAEIRQADRHVGRIVSALTEEGILDDTLVIVTSDHGENIGEHGMIDHVFSMFDTTLHVPLIVRFPERFGSGEVVDELVSLVDVAPTILDVCGVPGDDRRLHVERTSLCSAGRVPRSFVVAENDRPVNGIAVLREKYPWVDTDALDHPMQAIRSDRHKLVWDGRGVSGLYDLTVDPDETQNLAGVRPEIEDALMSLLDTWRSTLTPGDAVRLESGDAEAAERLRALGYVE